MKIKKLVENKQNVINRRHNSKVIVSNINKGFAQSFKDIEGIIKSAENNIDDTVDTSITGVSSTLDTTHKGIHYTKETTSKVRAYKNGEIKKDDILKNGFKNIGKNIFDKGIDMLEATEETDTGLGSIHKMKDYASKSKKVGNRIHTAVKKTSKIAKLSGKNIMKNERSKIILKNNVIKKIRNKIYAKKDKLKKISNSVKNIPVKISRSIKNVADIIINPKNNITVAIAISIIIAFILLMNIMSSAGVAFAKNSSSNDNLSGITAEKINPNMTQKEFIDKITPVAQQTQKEYGVFASITIAQAILESGWGRSGLTAKANNLFGIKAYNWQGPFVTMLTSEFYNGAEVSIEDKFRAYPSWADSIEDHGKFLKVNSNYTKGGVFSATDFRGQAVALKNSGYATDPDYPESLIKLILSYGLDSYDK